MVAATTYRLTAPVYVHQPVRYVAGDREATTTVTGHCGGLTAVEVQVTWR